MSLLCQIYRSPRRAETYLYVDKQRGLADVPEALLRSFGEPVEVMVISLSAQRRLARADAAEVLSSIAEQGFYLQLPPSPTAAMRRGRDTQ